MSGKISYSMKKPPIWAMPYLFVLQAKVQSLCPLGISLKGGQGVSAVQGDKSKVALRVFWPSFHMGLVLHLRHFCIIPVTGSKLTTPHKIPKEHLSSTLQVSEQSLFQNFWKHVNKISFPTQYHKRTPEILHRLFEVGTVKRSTSRVCTCQRRSFC